MAELEAQREEQRLQATIRKPADANAYQQVTLEGRARRCIAGAEAQRQEVELKAAGDAQRVKISAAAEAEQVKLRAGAEAEHVRVEASARAEATRSVGQAEADATQAKGMADGEAVRAKGMAEAEAIKARADALAENQDAVIGQQLAEKWPEIVEAAAKPFGGIDQLIVLNGAQGLSDALAQALSQGVAGLQMARSLLSGRPGTAATAAATPRLRADQGGGVEGVTNPRGCRPARSVIWHGPTALPPRGLRALGVASVAGGALLACGDGGGEQPDRTRRTARTYGNTTLVRRTAASDAPNVLFIAHRRLQRLARRSSTPTRARGRRNLDALAAECLSFDHAYCAAPMCGPARTAITFGTPPTRTACTTTARASLEAYGELAEGRPRRSSTTSGPPATTRWAPGRSTTVNLPGDGTTTGSPPWYIPGHLRKRPERRPRHATTPTGSRPTTGARSVEASTSPTTMIDFGPSGVSRRPGARREGGRWVCRAAARRCPREPFFLGFGNYIPHEPWRVPKRFFDMHPLEEVVVPRSAPTTWPTSDPTPGTTIIDQDHQFETDQQERPLGGGGPGVPGGDQLRGRPGGPHPGRARIESVRRQHRWSSSGATTGSTWARSSTSRSSRSGNERPACPCCVKVPGRFDHEQHVEPPVSTMDIGPTLAELCGIETRTPYAGASLLPDRRRTRRGPTRRPPITTWQEGNHSVRRGNWRVHPVPDGRAASCTTTAGDPDEFDNLASDPAHRAVIAELDAFLPAD